MDLSQFDKKPSNKKRERISKGGSQKVDVNKIDADEKGGKDSKKNRNGNGNNNNNGGGNNNGKKDFRGGKTSRAVERTTAGRTATTTVSSQP